MLIVQSFIFSNVHAYCCQLRCSYKSSKDVPAIQRVLHRPCIKRYLLQVLIMEH
ncbi:hypothetical protein BE22_0154 [Staphylococcus phage vB_SepS_BE22]|nr:hypothetical protein BE22_0154 [Staphylococcus phage vB_SepS_BE22]WNM53778.1 hypothetical protein CoNPh14_CDS0097 [Staphylococcus phage S-CoN_Ph14]WNM53920.1 hypothetical protein CoNPh15_CDS0074 [Staphylococcus phage S-CoN_Ph15]WNM54121.1 hypothetical protein CoNPh16_CDS0106 [Staphylococcus phage S-CoN_Ph16]